MILGEVGAEETVGPVRGRDLAGAPQARHVGPYRVARVRITVAPGEREDALDVRRPEHMSEGLRQEVLVVIGVAEAGMLALVVLVEGVDADRTVEPVARDPGEVRPVVAIAPVIERVEVVPHDLERHLGIGAVDLREGPGRDVARGLARATIDDRAFLVEVEAVLVLLERRGEGRLLSQLRGLPAPDLVAEIPLAVRLEELLGEEALGGLPVLAPEHGAGTERGAGVGRRLASGHPQRRERHHDEETRHDPGCHLLALQRRSTPPAGRRAAEAASGTLTPTLAWRSTRTPHAYTTLGQPIGVHAAVGPALGVAGTEVEGGAHERWARVHRAARRDGAEEQAGLGVEAPSEPGRTAAA